MQIVVTGGGGFIGSNLRVRLSESGYSDVVSVERATSATELKTVLLTADFVFHLAGVNRPDDPREFDEVNRGLTTKLCAILRESGRKTPIVYSSSIQAGLDNTYGKSKRAGEIEVERYGAETGAAVSVLRLPNVFGKWSRPNYNSAVATFCYNIAHGLPIRVDDPAAKIRLVYIDDVVTAMLELLSAGAGRSSVDIEPTYSTTVGDVVATITEFAESRQTLTTPRVGNGLTRALYATYMSFLSPEQFAYGLRRHSDSRGVFVEMLRTLDSGQVSYFTAAPGITRGEHYHHTKTEKFLVVKGRARFGFRHIITGESYEIIVSGEESRVVETVPGWAHDITNVGSEEMLVMLWANEVFDPERPDTIAAKVQQSKQLKTGNAGNG